MCVCVCVCIYIIPPVFGDALLPRPDSSKVTDSCIEYMHVDYMYVCVGVCVFERAHIHLHTYTHEDRSEKEVYSVIFEDFTAMLRILVFWVVMPEDQNPRVYKACIL